MTDAPESSPPPSNPETAPPRETVLNAAAVRGRLATVSRESYLLLFSLMKSVSVAAFAYAIAQFAGAEGDGSWWPRMAFWAASFAGVILTYHAALVGSVIHELRFSIVDSALPLGLCAVETLLFLVLANSPNSSQTPTGWYLAFAIWALLAAAIVWRVRREILYQAETGAEDIRRASLTYVQRLNIDGRMAASFACVAAVLWVMKSVGALNWLGAWEGIIGIGALSGLVAGLVSQEHAIRELRVAIRA